MSSYREQSLRAKAVRQGATDQRPVGGKSKKPKSVVVECRWLDLGVLSGIRKDENRWWKFGGYRDKATAEKAMEDHRRKHNGGFVEFRYRAGESNAV